MDNLAMDKSSLELVVPTGYGWDDIPLTKVHSENGFDGAPVLRQTTPRRPRNGWFSWPVLLASILGFVMVLVGITMVAMYSQGWMRYTVQYQTGGDVVGTVHTSDQQMATPFTFEDIFDSSLVPKGFSADFVGSGSKMVYRNDDGALMEFDPTTETEVLIMDNSTFTALNTGTYYVSWNLQYVLLAYDQQYIWRHSYKGKYKIYQRSTGQLLDFPNHPTLVNQTLELARFAKRTPQLAFVYESNLYFQASPLSQAEQITTNGDPLYVTNGKTNWLYEEDVLSTSPAHYFSNGGRYMLYAEFNDTGVPLMSMPLYGPKTNMYPRIIEFPYPKPGDLRDGQPGPNTRVRLLVADLVIPEGPRWEIPPPVELSSQDYYYTQVMWVDDDSVLIHWANRVQNHSIVTYCTASTRSCVKNHDYEVAGGWVDVAPPDVIVTAGGTSYITILPETVTGGQGDWLHVAEVTIETTGPGTVTYLSRGAQEARFMVGYDAAANFVYYLDTNGDSTERHLFRTSTGAGGNPNPECLTCAVGPGCLYVSAEFSTDGKYYIRTCRGPEIPTYTLIGIDDGLNRVLENNTDVAERLAQKLLPTRVFQTVDFGNGFQGVAEVFYPPGYDAGSNTTYRYLMSVYAGPNSKEVVKTYPIGGGTSSWMTYMKSSHNIVVTSVDGRGTHSNGQDYKFEMYKKLGTVEIEDQIAAANFFKTQPYVDADAGAAIFGWSYGGFTTALAVSSDPMAFQCGLSVAPVTHYHFYDTAYTERYQGLANENEAGYNATDITLKAANFHNKKFMINHGTADDNVQLKHYMQLVDALIKEGVQFRQGLYVDEAHSISGSSRHLYQSFTDFLLKDCWGE